MSRYLSTQRIIPILKLRYGIDNIYDLAPEQLRKLSTISVLSPIVASLTQYHEDGQNYINLIDALQSGNAGKINFTDLEKMLDSRFGRLSNETSKPKLGEENNPITLPEVVVLPLAEVNWADINNNLLPQKTLPYDPQKWFYEGIEWMKENPLQAAKQAASFAPIAGKIIDGYDIYTDLKNLNYPGVAVGLGTMLLPEFIEKGIKKGLTINPLLNGHKIDGIEGGVPRNTGIKSLFFHPSLLKRNEFGKLEVIRDWNDPRVNYKQGGKLNKRFK